MTHRPIKIAIAAAIAIAITAFALAKITSAASLWMEDHELRETLGGEKISGHYASGRKFNEDYRADGTLIYTEHGRKNSGKWTVTNGTFCTIYDTTTTGGCYQVSRVGSNCFEFYFVARTKKQAANPKHHKKPSWTARAWLRDKDPTCQDESLV